MAVPIGDVDRLKAVIGERGVGKSEWMIQDVRAFHKEVAGGYAIIHSPSARLPETLHDGTDSLITWHESVKSLESHRIGIAKNPERTHVVVSDEPEPVIEYARNLSKAVRRSAIEKAGFRFREKRPVPIDKNTGERVAAEPVYIGIDEGTALKQMKKGSDDLRNWEIFLTGLRHENVALTWSIQSPNARAYLLIEQASDIVAFRYGHEWGLNSVRARGLSMDEIRLIAAQKKFQFRHYKFNG